LDWNGKPEPVVSGKTGKIRQRKILNSGLRDMAGNGQSGVSKKPSAPQ
jgi:hypothetical protein